METHNFLQFKIIKMIVRRFCSSASRASSCRYFQANLIYLFYQIVICLMDYNNRNQALFQLGYFFSVIHCINSLLYLIIWQKLNIKIFSTFCLPDWLNLVAACIYLVSVFTYPYQLDPLFINYSEWFVVARRLDFIASVIDFIAIFLWVKQFYEYYQREYNSDPSSCIGKQINI